MNHPRETTMSRRDVLVIGSANVDVSIRTPRLPHPGETVAGDAAMISVGGKGANQAVAAARCGAPTRFAASIGDDAFGRMVLEQLDAQGVDRHDVEVLAGRATGLATILVDVAGQNCIAVAAGANAELGPRRIDALRDSIVAAAVIVLQCEIPMASVYRAIEIAAASGTRVVLNPAPYCGLDLKRLAGHLDILVPNETEAGQICGNPVTTPAEAIAAALSLQAGGIANVIITLGAKGCVLAAGGRAQSFPPVAVEAIDATGAGDAFVGCLAASLAAGDSLAAAIDRANAYAALSTTRRGAQASYADRDDLEHCLAAVRGTHS
jgi:ribokinase